ncbi:MAG: hypothetical protein M9892_03340 [Bacteroidetes bacterium]|nr:hypothetical protein [Bacteroidota bacterium]
MKREIYIKAKLTLGQEAKFYTPSVWDMMKIELCTRIEKRDFFEVFLERQLEVDGEPYSEAVAKQLPVADYYIIMEVLDNMLKALKPNFL